MTRIMFVSAFAGLLVAAYSVGVGLSMTVAVMMFIGEMFFCFAGIMFASHVMPELLSRHLDWQLRRKTR